MMRTRRQIALVAVATLISGIVVGSAGAAPSAGPLAFDVSFGAAVRDHPADGRLFVIVSTNGSTEPRFQIDIVDGTPFWGTDVSGMRPGHSVTVGTGPGVYGYPLRSLADLPAGRYDVQAFLNVYTTFHRSDGSVVQLHMPCGDGGFFWDSPGNLYSSVQHLKLGPNAGTIDLRLSHRIAPSDPVPPGGTCQQGNPQDSQHVKHVKIKSTLLTAFWGRPTYLGANILLPEGYDPGSDMRYPVIYQQTHFPFDNPFGFREDLGNAFSRWWVGFAAPRVIVVNIRHENPYFDDSYAVNSANLGPYGDAITTELVPYIQAHFKTVDSRWARVLTGDSTGGWEALAQQVFYPHLYSGTWSICPDPSSFQFLQAVNIYRDQNAYWQVHEWVKAPRPSAREVSGDTIWTMAEENHWELAMGNHGRSQLGQWDIWQAVYGPQGADGYPAPIWDKQSGTIDPAVADGWKPMDLQLRLRDGWATLGPLLAGRLHLFIGDADTFFLNNSLEVLKGFLDQVRHPRARAQVVFGHLQPHCWNPFTSQQLVAVVARFMQHHAPAGADTSWAGRIGGPALRPGSHVIRPSGRAREPVRDAAVMDSVTAGG
jgi:enterochelin esterase-like enzyme